MNSTANVLANFATVFPAAQEFLNTLIVVFGLAIAAYGLFTIVYSSMSQQAGQVSVYGGVISVFVGVFMSAFSATMQMATNTAFRSATPRSALSYTAPSGGDAAELIVTFVLYLTALFGWYWFFKGFYLVHRSGHPRKAQQDDFSKGGLRLIVSVFAVNLLTFTNMIASWGGFQNPLGV